MDSAKKNLLTAGGDGYFGSSATANLLVDAIDTSLYAKAIKLNVTGNDAHFTTVNDLWNEIYQGRARFNQRIRIEWAVLTEWTPMSPGLFHLPSSEAERAAARMHIAQSGKLIKQDLFNQHVRSLDSNVGLPREHTQDDFVEYTPSGKQKMILGGIGAVRLTPKALFNQNWVCILGATSNGVCHEGIPVLLSSDLYDSVIEQIKEKCSIGCRIIGRLCFLPTEELPIKYPRRLPKYCIWVEEIEQVKIVDPRYISISVAVNYSEKGSPWEQKKWSFATFHPDAKETHLSDAVDWISNYATRYSSSGNAVILSDFDESIDHFERVEFPLKDLARGQLDLEKLSEYSRLFNLKIVMGDNFENVSGTIINRSIVKNSFNKVKEAVDDKSAALLDEINHKVESSKDQNAVDNMEAFHGEIQKAEPKKTMLTTYWNAITAAIPNLLTYSGKVIELIEKISKVTGHA